MRQPRVVEPGFPHHVILRGNNRRVLFSYPRDYRLFLALVARATERHEVALHHLCLMRNHVHLLVTPDRADALARWVQAFAQRYAQRRNLRKGSTGKLFEERFRSFVITDERYLVACSVYVELNPVRAGLVARPADHLWSTYRLLSGDPRPSAVNPRSWTPTAFYRSFGASYGERARAFHAWFEELRRRPAPELPAPHERAISDAELLSAPFARRVRRPDGTRCL